MHELVYGRQFLCCFNNMHELVYGRQFLSVVLTTCNFTPEYYMNNNQLDALFIFNLLSCHTSTSFGRISKPSSGGIMYICRKWYLFYFRVDCQRAWWQNSPNFSLSIISPLRKKLGAESFWSVGISSNIPEILFHLRNPVPLSPVHTQLNPGECT
jgi:hypothetical protein